MKKEKIDLIKIKKIDLKLINFSSEIYKEKKKLIKLKKKNWDFFKTNQFALVIKKNKEIIGMIRVIKKKMFLGQKVIKVACLTNIGIRKIHQKKGYGRILISRSMELLKKEFDAALLIARKKLDFFYDKFGFVGNSEFAEMKIKFSKKNKGKINFKNSNYNSISMKLYNNTFSKKNGFLTREKNDWDYLKFKIKKNGYNFLSFFNNLNKEIGYIVYKKGVILEYAFDSKHYNFFYIAIEKLFKGSITIKNPTKNLINHFQKYNEIRLIKRICLYGGHMICIFNNKRLKKVKYNINYLDEF